MADPVQEHDPRQIGPYTVLGRLGAGGMGQVYLGQAPDGPRCAVKVIHPGLAQDKQFRARFSREVALARKVHGPHLARVLASDLDGPLPWLATEYVPGPSLEEAVTTRGPLPENEVRTMAAELFTALATIHAAGVVHRDIKPSNILLGIDGATLIDFGIAHAIDSTRITRTGMVIGSPAFMSPEQAAGAHVGPASDVFALAAVLVFASTGVGPYGTGSPAALLLRAADTVPQLDAVPEALRPMVELCLSKDPSARPSAAVLATTLPARAPARIPTELPSFGAGARNQISRRTRSASRRIRWLIAAGVAVAIATTATVVAVGSSEGTAPSVVAPPPVPTVAHPVHLTFADDVRDVAFSPDSRRAFVAHGAGLDVVDTATDTVTSTVALENPNVVAVSPDGTRVYVGIGNDFIQVLDTTTFRPLASIALTGILPISVAISPDGQRLCVASPIDVAVIDTATNVITRTTPIAQDVGATLAISGDGSQLFVKADNEVVAIATLDGSISWRKPIKSPNIAAAPGDQAYVIESLGGTLAVLNRSGRTTDLPAPRRQEAVEKLVSTPDGRHLYLLRDAAIDEGSAHQLEVVDPATGQATITIALEKSYAIPKMRVSPDGNQLVVIPFINPSIDIIQIADYK